jgi:hypothetical protein
LGENYTLFTKRENHLVTRENTPLLFSGQSTTFGYISRFEVFQQERPGRPHRNIGSVHAPDVEMALLNARDVFARRPEILSNVVDRRFKGNANSFL